MPDRDTLLKILDLARWAPSGDNTQPWRFEIVADDHVIVHGFDTRDHVLYDFDGHASHMAHGALLETMRVAASGFGYIANWTVQSDSEARVPTYSVFFSTLPGMQPDPLFPYIERRVVQRRPMSTAPLGAAQRAAIAAAAGENYTVQFFEAFPERLKVAKLLWRNAYIRLTCPEAFPVHQEIIEWNARFSVDRIPEQAVGVDPLTAKLMHWVMQSWGRVSFFNRYLLGTIPPRVQLDLLPALFCAAHVLIRPRNPPASLVDWINLGVAMQRIWLTVTQNELHLQPEMTPVIFRWYVQGHRCFSAEATLVERALQLAETFEQLACATRNDAFGFFCRIGTSQYPSSRSVRHDTARLMCKLR